MGKDLNEQAREILAIAEKHGVEQNFFFITVFKRYQVQLMMLTELEKAVKAEGAMVTKEYVKGRKNLYTNPAIGEYNKTSTAANQTVQTLIKVIGLREGEEDKAADALWRFNHGLDLYDREKDNSQGVT